MRVLLDNCIPWRLAKSIRGHDVVSVIHIGWADLTNGRLLDAMAGQFDVLVTVDKGIHASSDLTTAPSPLSSFVHEPTGFPICCRWFQRCFRP